MIAATHRHSISIYLSTDPASKGDAERIECRNLASAAVDQITEGGASKREVWPIEEQFEDLLDDDEFWAHQARSLALFVTPDDVTTFRLPNRLANSIEVSDRFRIDPLMRSLTLPQAAWVLELSQNNARLLEVLPEGPPFDATPTDIPSDVTDFVRASGMGPSARGRLTGSEGQKVRMRQYARGVDRSIRAVLSGSTLPLILAAAQPLDGIFRSANTYPHLADTTIGGNPEATNDGELALAARSVLDELHAADLADLQERFERRRADRLAITDLADVARAATFGLVDVVFADIDEYLPGSIGEDGAIEYADAAGLHVHGLIDEVVRRVWQHGGRVLAVRRDDVPGDGPVAAILRYLP